MGRVRIKTWLGLNLQTGMLFQGQQNILIQEHVLLGKITVTGDLIGQFLMRKISRRLGPHPKWPMCP